MLKVQLFIRVCCTTSPGLALLPACMSCSAINEYPSLPAEGCDGGQAMKEGGRAGHVYGIGTTLSTVVQVKCTSTLSVFVAQCWSVTMMADAPAMGECLPGAHSARARRATFLLTIPTSARDLPSNGEAPKIDHDGLCTFPTKHVA